MSKTRTTERWDESKINLTDIWTLEIEFQCVALMGILIIIKNTFRKCVHLPAVGNMLAATMLCEYLPWIEDFFLIDRNTKRGQLYWSTSHQRTTAFGSVNFTARFLLNNMFPRKPCISFFPRLTRYGLTEAEPSNGCDTVWSLSLFF